MRNIVGEVGAHRSICRLHCKEMVETVGLNLPEEVESMTVVVIRGAQLAQSRNSKTRRGER